MEIINPVSFDLNHAEIRKRLRLSQNEQWNSVQPCIEEIQPLFRSKAVFKVAYIEEKHEDTVVVDGHRFVSRVLRKNLKDVERVFLYVITIGQEVSEKIGAAGDILSQYYFDTIANVGLHCARLSAEETLKKKYRIDDLSFMSPGSLQDWPLSEQKILFQALGDAESAIGVRLTDSLLMVPNKSISGIFFPAEIKFYSCQLCPREECPSRKAAYDATLAGDYGVID
jgi:hypothetical protein